MLRKLWLVLIVLSLVILLIPACGGDGDDETPASTITNTTTTSPDVTPTVETATPASTTTTSGSPVKIGAIAAWSGPAAITGSGLADPVIKLVEKQVKDQGGVMGGREVKIVRYDNTGSVAQASAGVKKLVYDDKVSVVTLGGVSGAEFDAVADAAEEIKVLYVSFGTVDDLEKYTYVINGTVQRDSYVDQLIDFVLKVIKPDTAAYLGAEGVDSSFRIGALKEGLEAAGVDTVYEDHFQLGTVDYSMYLTTIKYKSPDFLFLDSGQNEFYVACAKQMTELAMTDIEVLGTPALEYAKKQPGAEGWYEFAMWVPGVSYPGAIKFYDDFMAMHNREPSASQVYYYNCFWTAINAIELAGTDTDLEKINEAAHSGNLTWDTPMGTCHYTADGQSGLSVIIAQVVDKELVLVDVPK